MKQVITSKSNPKVKHAISLKESKNRKAEKLFLAETFNALELALIHHQVVEIFTTVDKDYPEDISVYLVNEEILKKISQNVNPEGVVFICKMKEEIKKSDKILYLDHISDPGNLGTLIRTALAFDYDLVVTSPDSVDLYNPKVVNSTKGAIFALPVMQRDIKEMKRDHEVIVSLLDQEATPVEDIKVGKKFILVLGNESHGVSSEAIKEATQKVYIPIKNIDLGIRSALQAVIGELDA